MAAGSVVVSAWRAIQEFKPHRTQISRFEMKISGGLYVVIFFIA
jgi:hypothetical protein